MTGRVRNLAEQWRERSRNNAADPMFRQAAIAQAQCADELKVLLSSRAASGTPSDDAGFVIGVLWAAWWLHRAHGEDTYAKDLLRESFGAVGIDEVRRVARREGYHFKHGFWAEVKR